jgi:hypothetical protein
MPVSHGSYVREKAMMHEKDCQTGLDANIPPFGVCRSPENSGQQISISDAADLVPYQDEYGRAVTPPLPIEGRLCAPALPAKWIDAQEETLVDGVPALTKNCTITCQYGGIICFIDDGQEVG